MIMQNPDTNEVVAEFGKSNGLIRYEPAKTIPVFCMFAVFEEDCKTNENGDTLICLSDDKKATIRQHFPNADSVAIIPNPEQFINDVINSIGCEIKHDIVHYFHIDKGFDTDSGQTAIDMEYMKYLTQDAPPVIENGMKRYTFYADYVYRVLFCKDVFFEKEQEYRIVLPKECITEGTMYPVTFSCKYIIQNIEEVSLKTSLYPLIRP